MTDLANRGFETIDTQVWTADIDRPGYLKLVRTKTVGEVYRELRGHLADEEGLGEYFQVSYHVDHDEPWPVDSMTVVFAVNGSSEGDYVHVEAHGEHGAKTLMLGKGFGGRDAAWQAARRIADLLHA